MNADLETLYVVAYSVNQDAFHVCTLRDMLSRNLRNLARLVSTDYVTVAVATTHERAGELASELRAQLDQFIESERARRREAVMSALESPQALIDLLSDPRLK